MGAIFPRYGRWLLLALALMAFTAALMAGPGATSAEQAGPSATGTLYLPYIGNARPPQIEFAPFAVVPDNKTIMDISSAGDGRIFVASREGRIWIVNPDGTVNTTPFLDASKLVQHEVNFEQGLLGVAFHPDYPATPYFYFAYTSPGHIQIVRAAVSETDPNLADSKSIRVLMAIAKPRGSGGPSPVHNAGDLAFGPDGYLYIPVGDGGPDPYDPLGVPGDPLNNSQRRDTMLGSILRIDPEPARGLPQDCGEGNLYSVPHNNPWLNDSGCDEIWAIGFRNPWRMAIDRLTGDFYIADVGEWMREEINYYPAGAAGGANFGWHCYEGSVDYAALHPQFAGDCSENTQYVFPIHEYDHSLGECSVIGGRVYRGQQYPSLYGRYFFGDFCSGRVWTMLPEGSQWKVEPAGRNTMAYSTFGEDANGELYAGEYGTGTLFRLIVR